MKIGLVLASPPGYSETFFTNKIKGLQQHGVEIILFVNHKASHDKLSCKIVCGPSFNSGIIRSTYTIFVQVFKALTINLPESLKLYRLDSRAGSTLRQCLRNLILNQFLLGEQLDWLHFGFGTMALGRENVAAAIGAKMAVSFRGFDIGIYPVKHPGCYSHLFRMVDKIHTISDDLTKLLYKQGLTNNVPVVKITPAIDSSFFNSAHVRPVNMKLKILTIARLHWKKGLEHTLKALSILKHEGIKFEYIIVGEGTERERLMYAAYKFGIQSEVSFRGRLSAQEVRKELEKADIYLQYSLQEGFCNAVLEAQAMGLLCLVSDAEGLSENVLNGVTGWVVPKRNPLLLAKKVQEIILLPANVTETIRKEAIERVKSQFNLIKQRQEFLRFYNVEQV